jgi:hypothetical protein
MNTTFNVYIYICFILFPLLYYNYSFIYLYKGYASCIYIFRGYVKHKRMRTTDLRHRLRRDESRTLTLYMSNTSEVLEISNTAVVCVLVCSLVSDTKYEDGKRDMTIPFMCTFYAFSAKKASKLCPREC